MLNSITCKTFLAEIASDHPTPSGGAVIGSSGALACSLGAMVANISSKNKKYEKFKNQNLDYYKQLLRISDSFLKCIDEDGTIFKKLKGNYNLPDNTSKEKEIKKNKLNKASILANEIPLKMINLSQKALEILNNLQFSCSPMIISDIGISSLLIKTVLQGSWITILINQKNIFDKQYIDQMKKNFNKLEKMIRLCDSLYNQINKELIE